jgi:hypothetical protein
MSELSGINLDWLSLNGAFAAPITPPITSFVAAVFAVHV